MVLVEARALGKRRPLVPQWSVPVSNDLSNDGGGGLTLRQLIERIVRAEVSAFHERQRARQFVRALSASEIDAAARKGKVDPGGHEAGAEVDPESAVATALQGFEDGLYLVLLDGEEQRDLDRQVYVSESSRVTFLRLVFLAGG